MISTKNRLGRVLEVTPDYVRLQTSIMAREQVIQRTDITTVQVNRSVYDLPFLEKTVTFWTKDGKKHTVKYLRAKVAQEIANELNKHN